MIIFPMLWRLHEFRRQYILNHRAGTLQFIYLLAVKSDSHLL